jgi:potassium-transporting ATPase potassium-binding subunit
MTAVGWIQITVFLLLLVAVIKPLGTYMFRVYEGERQPLPRLFGRIERFLYRLCGVDPTKEQTWKEYALALLLFSAVTLVVTYAIQRLQHLLPLNPESKPAVPPHLAFNTAVSFTTNTNWQSYAGETTMSYLTQMAGLAWHQFISAGAGIGVALAMARGLTRQPGPDGARTLGNFWVDLIRSVVYLLLPLSILMTVALIAGGVIQNFSAYVDVDTVEGGKQTLAMGPAASLVAIKQLGTNGGGFFNVNSSHPFENPNAFTNFLECLAILAIPAALTYTYGRMARDTRQGWALAAAMFALCVAGIAVCYWAEAHPNAAMAGASIDRAAGNLEGKEVRFGIASSATWAVMTTDASNGSVNSMHDSYTPLGGLVPLTNIMLGEVIFGGVGAGLYGALIFVMLAVFIAGLMVGRTPEYLGKKIEAREMKLAMFYILIFPLILLGGAAWAAVASYGVSSLNNGGPHGLSEILYTFASWTGNNGSAFAGMNANVPFYDTVGGVAMLAGRFLMIIPCLAIGGSMIGKKIVPAGPGTFPTNGPIFVMLLVSVIVIVGALTFFPALSLGPVVEHFLQGSVF